MPDPTPKRRPATMSAADFQAQAKPKPAKGTRATGPTNKLTQAIIALLKLHRYDAWRQNNNAVYDASFGGYRKGSVRLGIPDVLAFCLRTGRFAVVEVKVGADELSAEQTAFLASVKKAGGFACEGRTLPQVEQELKAYLATPPPH